MNQKLIASRLRLVAACALIPAALWLGLGVFVPRLADDRVALVVIWIQKLSQPGNSFVALMVLAILLGSVVQRAVTSAQHRRQAIVEPAVAAEAPTVARR